MSALSQCIAACECEHCNLQISISSEACSQFETYAGIFVPTHTFATHAYLVSFDFTDTESVLLDISQCKFKGGRNSLLQNFIPYSVTSGDSIQDLLNPKKKKPMEQ
jgi:hypothetical protein